MKHAVFAYNFREAQEHARASGLQQGQWIYADRRYKLEGLDPAQVITHQVEGWELNDGCRWGVGVLQREMRRVRRTNRRK